MSQKEESPLQSVWNGIYNEYLQYRNNTLGKLLTLIDSIIVNEKQNKSVKDLIRNVIWDNSDTEFNLALWFCWLNDNFNLEARKDNGSSEPMKYDSPPVGDFRNYQR